MIQYYPDYDADQEEALWEDYSSKYDVVRDGMWRRIFEDAVSWQPDYLKEDSVSHWDYGVCKYAFVPGFHVVQFDDGADDQEYILSSHKTLHEAMGVCKVLLANGGVHYD